MATEDTEAPPAPTTVSFSAPAWLRDLGLTSWFLIGCLALVAVGRLAARRGHHDRRAPRCRQHHRDGQRARGQWPSASSRPADGRRSARPAGAGRNRRRGRRAGDRRHHLPGRRDLQGGRRGGRSWPDRGSRARASTSPDRRAQQRASAADVPKAIATLVKGTLHGLQGLTSVIFGLSLAFLSTFFLLKDGPSMRRWLDDHLGVPRGRRADDHRGRHPVAARLLPRRDHHRRASTLQ